MWVVLMWVRGAISHNMGGPYRPGVDEARHSGRSGERERHGVTPDAAVHNHHITPGSRPGAGARTSGILHHDPHSRRVVGQEIPADHRGCHARDLYFVRGSTGRTEAPADDGDARSRAAAAWTDRVDPGGVHSARLHGVFGIQLVAGVHRG